MESTRLRVATMPSAEAAAPVPTNRRRGLSERAAAAAAVAASFADEVDRDIRFPREAIEALRAERLLGITLPAALGGEDARVSDVVDICYQLGQACASAAMIYAMHQSCVACVARHGLDSQWHRDFLRQIANEQWLLASSTTEGQAGGNVRASAAPVERTGSDIRLERAATVVSYGAEADAIVTTARRSATAAANDQVLVAFLTRDCTLTRTVAWDPLGMRGTCSAGFAMVAAGRDEQILPEPYENIHAQSMVPVSHLSWAACWMGIAAAATARARAFCRRAARQTDGTPPPGAAHVTKAYGALQTLRGLIATSLRNYEQLAGDPRALMSFDFQAMMNLTKVEASEAAVAIVLEAGRACGLAGYRNDSEFSVGRHLRDVVSAPIMINNARILANLAKTTLLATIPATISDSERDLETTAGSDIMPETVPDTVSALVPA